MKTDNDASTGEIAENTTERHSTHLVRSGLSSAADVGLLGEIAHHFVSSDFRTALSVALCATRQHLQADDAELFIAEPEGGRLILLSCCGENADALVERVSFAPGEGFPGRVAATGRPVLSRHLPQDERFVRTQLKQRGLESFASVPIWLSEQVRGSLNLSWRRHPASFDHCVEVCGRVGALIAGFAAAHFAVLREKINGGMDPRHPPGARLEKALAVIAEQAASPRAIARLFESSGGPLALSNGDVSLVDLPNSGHCPCRAVLEGHGAIIDQGRYCESPCSKLQAQMSRPCRLAIYSDGCAQGCLLLDLDTDNGRLPSEQLLSVLVMAQQTARRLPDRRREPEASAGRLPAARPASGADLFIRCLGGLKVQRRGQIVEADAFERKKAMEALELLALAPEGGLSRDQLIDQLWPQADRGSAANRLYVVIHALRNALEPDGSRDNWRFVHSGRDRYWLDRQASVEVDVWLFERSWRQVRRAQRQGHSTEAICSILAAMLDVYRGDLLDGRRRDWCLEQRASLRRVFLDATRLCADLLVDLGRSDEAIDRLRRGIEIDECDEQLHQRLIRLLVGTGQHRLASHQYEECVTTLRTELDCEPLPETQQLEQLLIAPRH